MPNPIQWTNALSTRPSLEAAVAEVIDAVQRSLSGNPDLGIFFISSAYTSEYSRLVPLLLEKLPLPILLGCGGGGIIGMNADRPEEVEATPALSLSVACLPEVEVTPFYLNSDELPDLDSPPQGWVDLIGVPPEKQPHFILLADPFFARINDLLEGLDFAYPGSVKIGGLASAGTMGVPSGLFCHAPNYFRQSFYHEGAVGIALSGNINLETIVAQGCRPIGKPYRISKGERNIILELTEASEKVTEVADFRPPLEFLQNLIQNLSEKDRTLAQNSLFVGIARDEFKLELGQGDFLIRNLLGVDPRIGAMAIGDRVRPGQRIQFHLRDAQTSAEDLQLLLKAYQQEKGGNANAVGALMFSCLGRGENLYNRPNFDSELFCGYLNNIPLGGFFCNGEIGPVGGRTFVHGYTSAFAIIRQVEISAFSS